jgi:hypothetical protein
MHLFCCGQQDRNPDRGYAIKPGRVFRVESE